MKRENEECNVEVYFFWRAKYKETSHSSYACASKEKQQQQTNKQKLTTLITMKWTFIQCHPYIALGTMIFCK